MSDDDDAILPLPIPLDHLIHSQTVESVRVEFKKTWNDVIRPSVLRTICAFANDIHHLNGGYIVIGVEEQQGRPLLPPHGLDELNIDQIQKQIRGQCKQIDPQYQPVLFPTKYQGRQVLVVFAAGGGTRPYQAPRSDEDKQRSYFIREGSETIDAKGQALTALMQLSARVPFDDRGRNDATLSDVSTELVRQYLRDVGSELATVACEPADLLRIMGLSSRANGHEVPRNVALLMFHRDPQMFFSGVRIEIAQFFDDAGGDLIEEKTIRGPLIDQIRGTLSVLVNLVTSVTRKIAGQAEAHRYVSYPYGALEEAIANAILHRGYDSEPEPVKVYLYPDRLEIISYPGPVPGLRREDLEAGARSHHAPPRNRRIGEFLKELRLVEMRSTGIPKIRRHMKENGSPEPTFDFDESRTWFQVTLPAHPEYVVLTALREAAGMWATGQRNAATERLELAHRQRPESGALLAQLIDYHVADNDLAKARSVFASAAGLSEQPDGQLPVRALARAFTDAGLVEDATRLLSQAPLPADPADHLEWAILYKRNNDLPKAHEIFESSYNLLQNNAKAMHEFAQTKIGLSKVTHGKHQRVTQTRLMKQAAELLRRVIQLDDNPMRIAWAWFDLAKTLKYLRAPTSEIEAAIQQARALQPNESRFTDWSAN